VRAARFGVLGELQLYYSGSTCCCRVSQLSGFWRGDMVAPSSVTSWQQLPECLAAQGLACSQDAAPSAAAYCTLAAQMGHNGITPCADVSLCRHPPYATCFQLQLGRPVSQPTLVVWHGTARAQAPQRQLSQLLATFPHNTTHMIIVHKHWLAAIWHDRRAARLGTTAACLALSDEDERPYWPLQGIHNPSHEPKTDGKTLTAVTLSSLQCAIWYT
jgi:hypothetical protein